MPIYYDPTEARDNTRLSQFVVQEGKPLEKLEALTGGDILIHPNGAIKDLNKPPGVFWNEQLCLLVQRKSGSDFFHSLTDGNKYTHILQRMQQFGSKVLPWLMVDGNFTHGPSGCVVIDGRSTGFKWRSYEGVMDWWQMRGGYVHWSNNEDACAEWLLRWSNNVAEVQGEVDIVAKPFTQSIKGGLFDEHPWRMTLMTFDGTGQETADQVVEYVQPGGLAQALAWMSDPIVARPKGIGDKTVQNWRKWLGLKENQILVVADLQDELQSIRFAYGPQKHEKVLQILGGE